MENQWGKYSIDMNWDVILWVKVEDVGRAVQIYQVAGRRVTPRQEQREYMKYRVYTSGNSSEPFGCTRAIGVRLKHRSDTLSIQGGYVLPRRNPTICRSWWNATH